MSKDPSEMTARQQRRMQYMEKRGRGGRVAGQPTEMPQQELTARQQRRQQYLQRRDARRERAVADYRAQQQAPQGLDPFANVITGQRQQDTPGLPVDMSAIVPYSQDLAQQFGQQFGNMQIQPAMDPLPPGMTAGGNPNLYTQTPDGRTIGTYMGYPGMGMQTGGVAMPPRPDAQGVGDVVGGFIAQPMKQNPMDANPFAQSRNKRATPYGPVGSAPFRMGR